MSTRELFSDLVCEFRPVILVMIVIDLVILGLMLTTLPFLVAGQLDRGTVVISAINYVLIFLLLAALVAVYRWCGRRN